MAFKNGHDDPKVASLEEARRRAEQKAKAERRAAAGQSGTRSARDWIIGGMIVLMAFGYMASFFAGNSGLGTVAPVSRENPEAGK